MSDEIIKRINIDKYIHLIPEFLRDNDSFLVFFQLLVNEFNITEYNIEHFTDLVNPDKVPIQFIEYLGMFMNYHYQDRGTEEFNRDLLMSQRTIWEMRGTDHAIIMAATHGDNEGYVGGDIFIPDYPISKDLAEITVARDKIFIHSKSAFSSSDVYSDSAIYRPGIIIISVTYIDKSIRDRIDEVIPAGLKYVFTLMSNFAPSEGADIGDYGELSWGKKIRVVPVTPPDDSESINNPINMVYEINMGIDEGIDKDTLVHSRPFGRIHSGRMKLRVWYENDYNLGVSALPISVLRRPFNLSSQIVDINGNFISSNGLLGVEQDLKEKTYEERLEENPNIEEDKKLYIISDSGEYLDRVDKLTTDSVSRNIDSLIDVDFKREVRMSFVRSDSRRGKHSYHGKNSGLYTGVFDEYVPVQDIQPFDVLYPASEVWDLKPTDSRQPFYQADIEIEELTI